MLDLRSLMVRIARAVPPIGRLHDERNALQSQVAEFQKRHDVARAEWQHELEKRRQGLVIELDYPCLPQARCWDRRPAGNPYRRMIDAGEERYATLLASFLRHQAAFTRIPVREPPDERTPYWDNRWFPMLDAVCLTGLLAALNPRRYVEVGSGNSTKFVRRAISDHGLRTRVTSIDPSPRAGIDDLCDEVIRDKLENCDPRIFEELGPEDIVFVDGSHRTFQGSDATVFFTELLPLLKPGCHYGIHDIFLPSDYQEPWLARYYSEQYLLMSYLLGGARGDAIVLPVCHIARTPGLLEILARLRLRPTRHVETVAPIGGS
jgi:hypothetical protein